jgi:UrcA family protein
MSIGSGLPRRFTVGRNSVAGAAIVLALLGVAPLAALADPPVATEAASRVADVPLADLDLSTADGMRAAGERLRAMAERLCAEPAKNRGLPPQPNFTACVDSTVAAHLKQINALKKDKVTVRNSVTHAANVSLADLDLSTAEGASAAHERLEAMARRLCTELASSDELEYELDYGTCVHYTLAGALAQANALARSKQTRTARRTAP